MEINEFCSEIKKQLVKRCEKEFGDDFDEVLIQSIYKLNGTVLHACTIVLHNAPLSPNIYLDSFYLQYCTGKPMSFIVNEIMLDFYDANDTDVAKESVQIIQNLSDKDYVLKNVFIMVINAELNSKMLEEIVHERKFDLAFTVRLLSSKNEKGIVSSYLPNWELEKLDLSVDEVLDAAYNNTKRIFPVRIKPMQQVIFGLIEKFPTYAAFDQEFIKALKECTIDYMYVISNDVGINGAFYLFDKETVQKFSEEQAKDLFLLPSSIHEGILLPELEETDIDFLKDMVRCANNESVGQADLLSQSVYKYCRDTNEIIIV